MTRITPTPGEVRTAAEAVATLAGRPTPPLLARSLRDLAATAAALHRSLRPGLLAGLLSPVPLGEAGAEDEALRTTAEALEAAERALREEADRQRGTAAAIDRAGRHGAPGPAATGAAAARARAAVCDEMLAAAAAWREAAIAATGHGAADGLAAATARLRDLAASLARGAERDLETDR